MDSLKFTLRSVLRELALNILSIGAKPSNGIHLLNGHLLTSNKELDASFFDDQLKILSKNSKIIPFDEAVHLINNKQVVNHSLIAFSYDDGFEECYTHIAPVLEKYNGYACFFICPHFIDGNEEYIDSFLSEKVHQKSFKRPMKWEQIKDLHERGHTIGAHTLDHVRLSKITDDNILHYQIGNSKNLIIDCIDSNCDYFAFPYGIVERDFNLKSIEIAKQYFNYLFSASNYKNYYSYGGKVFNRRQIEPDYKASHANYFLSKKMDYS